MIIDVLYKGESVNINDIKVVWTDWFGDVITGDINDYGKDKFDEGFSESESGEGW